MEREQMKKEIEDYMLLNNFDEGSYLLGIKHGFNADINNVSIEIVKQIVNAAYEYLNMCRESGITNEDIHLLRYTDILRIAQQK